MPLFSILIPCYNQAHFLPDCLDSLLLQDFQDWEAIVVNDGATDNTSAVAQMYAAKDARIQLLEKVNGGLSSARNAGIRQAVGERFIFLDADDFMYPNALQKISEQLGQSTYLDLIQYGYTYVKEDGTTVLGHTLSQKKEQLIPGIFAGNIGPCHSICISSELVAMAGNFDETLKSAEDWDFWIRTAKAGAVQIVIQEPLVYYRYVKNSMSRNPFVMYAALKTVVSRSALKDSRIIVDKGFNKAYDFDSKPTLSSVLLRSIGVGIMQDQVPATFDFFNHERPYAFEHYNPKDFDVMCSYLTFRYWYSRVEIDEVLEVYYPRFVRFFEFTPYSKTFVSAALYFIFSRHIAVRNHTRYGTFFGSLLNFLQRNYFEWKTQLFYK